MSPVDVTISAAAAAPMIWAPAPFSRAVAPAELLATSIDGAQVLVRFTSGRDVDVETWRTTRHCHPNLARLYAIARGACPVDVSYADSRRH